MSATVTIYKNDSIMDVVMDEDKKSEWDRLTTELGIEIPTEVKKQRPIPFLLLNQRMINMFKVLCPNMNEITKYSREPIPLEVLKIASFCKKEGFFTRMEVWFDDKSPDPVLVGVKTGKIVKTWYYGDSLAGGIPDKKWHGMLLSDIPDDVTIPSGATEDRTLGTFLIARWGDEDKPFNVLRDKAASRMRYTIVADNEQRIRDARRAIDDIEATIARELPI